MNASLSPSTQKTYNAGLQLFEDFRRRQLFRLIWPPPLNHLVNFISFMSIKNYSPSTMSTNISAISFSCKMSNSNDPTQTFIIKKMLQGVKRIDKREDSRSPITLGILNKIVHSLPSICSSNYEATLFSAIFVFAFFGFFRIGELVQNSKFDLGHALQIKDVSFNSRLNAVEINIAHSKTDKKAKGTPILLPASGSVICPVKAYLAYTSIRPNFIGAFFCHLLGMPVTRYQCQSVLQKALTVIGLSNEHFCLHSFRIGAATSAHLSNFSNEDIAKYGRWSSNAFKTYIRIPSRSFKV